MGPSRRRRVTFLALAVSLASWPAAGRALAAGDVPVEGRVVDGRTGQPVAGAVLFVRGWRVLSDADGRFSMTLPPGRSGLRMARPGHPSLTARPAAGTRLRAAFGIHTQSPGYEKLRQADYAIDLSADGRLNLANERARHYVVGVERDLALGVSARVEGFYKRFEELLIGRLETAEEVQRRLALYDFPAELSSSIPHQPMITAQPTSDGKGRACGFDVFLTRRAVSSHTRLAGWLAYTYTSANRQAYGRTCSFDYEQRHALSVVANLRASQRLELSVTSRFTSGFPRTPPLGLYVTGINDTADGDGLTAEVVPERDGEGRLVYAIDYGSVDNLNRERRPWHGRVDFRATFVPSFGVHVRF